MSEFYCETLSLFCKKKYHVFLTVLIEFRNVHDYRFNSLGAGMLIHRGSASATTVVPSRLYGISGTGFVVYRARYAQLGQLPALDASIPAGNF